ncbi:MAG TPA: helix-turn-helix transcriptional regulator [Flavitalea sp.]|nr:helix-turn-helix transcriptional regulator [Flavitalea sp.]
MKFEAHYPIHPQLKKYIHYYYFVKTDQKNHHSSYYSFPNVTVPVNIHKNVTCTIEGDAAVVSACENSNFVTVANGLRERPLKVKWNGLIDKVTIAFTAVGINHFICKNLNETVEGYTNFFTEWDGNNYTACLEEFYAEPDNRKRIIILEIFLVGIYRPFEKGGLLQEIINLLSDFTPKISVPEIARQVNISERTLNRLFQLHIGVPPIAYRKIARFRKSLEDKVIREKFKRLTDISYENNYYDQSYFIRMYNNLSGKSPKDLHKCVNKLADGNVIFEFIEKPVGFD